MNLDVIKQELKKTLSKERFLHTLRVQKTAIGLAKKFKIPYKKASIAGLLHDCGKFPFDKMEKLIKEYKIKLDKIEKKYSSLWHSILSSEITKRKFHIKDKEILQAIKRHTTGNSNMSELDMIIYIADLTEYGRGEFKDLSKVRKLIKNSLVLAFKEALRLKIKYVLDTDRTLHPNSIACWNWVINISK